VSRNFSVTPEAELDVLEIWEYIAEDDSETAASRVIDRIRGEFQKLGDMPGIGHFREELLDSSYKFWSVWSYVIVYRWQSKPIEIVAVVHGARDLQSYFSGYRP
jgi:plasmid stabilization system protein ParE